ncbi:MAG: hypothetical protein WDN75_04235 [Bacteroidota bacterium]
MKQALISDITWITEALNMAKGVAISLRDRNIPRREFIDKIIGIAQKHKVPYQLEVEGMGSSDGGELQRAPYPFDCASSGRRSFIRIRRTRGA